MSNKINNISKLFKTKCIKVPVIQRDYAQGREDDLVNNIRKDFIESLFEAVNNNQIMDINYIYGINKQGDDFLPIDGQQRLTSIFLFLWFCSIKEGKSEVFCKCVKSFSYMVRSTSEEFFDALQKIEKGQLAYLNDFEEYVKTDSASLRNCSWYRFEWNHDMTVQGALTFLDSIKKHIQQQNISFGKFTDILLDDEQCPISFILMVQNEAISEDLSQKEKEEAAFEAENRAAITYINMNERGKKLDDFENLKALMNKTCKAAEVFVNKYDNEYIDVFFKLADKKKSDQKPSLAKRVSNMDMLTLSFILNVFNDFEIMNDTEESYDYYQFMRLLRGKPDFKEGYFEFMTCVLENYGSYTDEEIEVLYNYCNNHNNPNRYAFFVTFWDKYKGLTKDDYWKNFKEHINLKGIVDLATYHETYIKIYKYLIKLINELTFDFQKTELLEVLKSIDVDRLYSAITEKNKHYTDIIDKATLKEEKIKADIILSRVSNKPSHEIIDIIEEVGQRHKHKLRYLLYISDLWDESVDDNSWETFVRYANIDKEVFQINNDLMWKKIFYLSGLEHDSAGKAKLPLEGTKTFWEDNLLEWKDVLLEPKEKTIMSRIKECFDEIYNAKGLRQMLDNEISLVGNDRSFWLYYLLNKPYEDLLKENISYDNGVYLISEQNFYEYVLCKDLKEKGVVCSDNGNLIKLNKLVCEGKEVCPKSNDGFLYKKYMDVSLDITYKISKAGFRYIQGEKSMYRFKYDSIDGNSREDRFIFEEDNKVIESAHVDMAIKTVVVKRVISQFFDDDYYNWVFKGECDELKQKLCKDLNINEDSCSCYKTGSKNVVITIEVGCGFTPIKSDDILSHTAIETGASAYC